MIFIRSTLFNMALIGITLVLGILGLPLLAVPRVWTCRLRDLWIALLLLSLRVIVGTTYRVEGLQNVPAGRFIIACKHQSAWETLAIHQIFPDPSIVFKRELLWLPLLGWYIRKVGMIAIDRGAGSAAIRTMLETARRWSTAGRPVLIFPQGTRVAWGENVPYHPGVYALYRALDIPVISVALNSGRFWPRQGYLKRPGLITVRILPAIPQGLDRRDFMARLETGIETATALLGPTPPT